MERADQKRRQLIKGILGTAALPGLASLAFADTGPRIRIEWQQFNLDSTGQCNTLNSA